MMIVRCTASALVVRSLPDPSQGTDLGKRMLRGQTGEAWGKSLDGQWLYVDAPAARGWCSAAYLEEAPGIVLPSAAWPRVPRGLSEIVRIFGEPGKPLCYAGRVHLPAPLKLSWADETVTTFACHKLVEDVLTSVFQTLHDRGLWDLVENFGGCYNYRPVKASSKISTHAWGISVDIDTLDNALGAVPRMDPRIIRVFEDHGCVWGGRWSRPDGMHFQFAIDY